MYLAYLLAALFILVFAALQKFVDSKRLVPAAEPEPETDKTKKHKGKKVELPKFSIKKSQVSTRTFVAVAAAALVIRMILGYFLKGYPTDMSCWTAWGAKVISDGPGHFYAPDYFCDYPPGYITILGFFAWINKIFHLSGNATQLCFKMPGILADLGLMIAVFKIGTKHIDQRSALILGIIFMLNPLLIVNSSAWGQVESVLALFLVLAMYNLYKKNWYLSGVLYVLAVLIKPQALMVGPVFLFAFLASRDWKMILKMIGIGLVLAFIFIVPYNYAAWTSGAGFFGKLVSAFNPVWIIKKYSGTLASYPYFTINAFNFYAMLKLNWVTLETGGMSQTLLNVLNYALILVAVAGSLLLFFKIKSESGRIFIPSFFIIAFLFTFGLKMHERYLITPIIFLFFEYLVSRNKRTLYVFAAFSAVNLINVFCVLRYILMYNTSGPPYSAMAVASVLEVVTFIVSMIVLVCDYVIWPKEAAENATPLDNWCARVKSAYYGAVSRLGEKAGSVLHTDPKKPLKTEKIVRADMIIMAVIVLIYGVVTYANLGGLNNPESFYKPSAANENVTIDLGSTQTVDTVTYYLGIGDVGKKPGMKLSASNDGRSWTDINVDCKLNSVFKWEVVKLSSPTQARYIRGVTESDNYRMFEIAFWRADGSMIDIASVSGPGDCANIADEPDTAQYRSSFKNSTYFDEIYHPRTAYENLHMMPYYETTHPPLGKLIIAIGIAIFGMCPFGWRFMGATFGIIMLPLMYILLKKLFERTRYSVLGTLIFAFDFMHFSLTRLGTIDSYPVTFIIAMYLFMFLFGKRALGYAQNSPEKLTGKKTFPRLMGSLALSGLMFGLGAASKWICIYAGAGLAVELLLIFIGVYMALPKKKKNMFWGFVIKTCLLCLIFFVAIPGFIYVMSYLPISMVEGYPDVWHTMLNNQTYMFNYHSNLDATHPYSSKWFQWPIDYRPLWAYSAPTETVGQDKIGCISVFGNPLVFWSSIAAFIYTIVIGIIKRDKKVLFLVVGMLAQFLPWVLVTRCVFIYHFFASTPFLIAMIVYTLRDLEQRFGWFRHISNAYVALCGLLFVAFYPVLSAFTISKDYSNTWLRWFNTWVFHNRGN